MTSASTPIHPFAPGCTLHVRAGIAGARAFQLLVRERRVHPDGTVTAWGHQARQDDGSLGQQRAVTLSYGEQFAVANSPYDTIATGTHRGRGWSLARKDSTVTLWADNGGCREFACKSAPEAVHKFEDIAAQLRA